MKYAELQIKTLDSGKQVYRIALPSSVRIFDDDVFIITTEGERFDNLASKYYGHPSLWWAIASANNLVNGSLAIKPGTPIIIPRLSEI